MLGGRRRIGISAIRDRVYLGTFEIMEWMFRRRDLLDILPRMYSQVDNHLHLHLLHLDEFPFLAGLGGITL